MSSEGWLERYRRGDREQVWHELRQLGARVRDPRTAVEAQAVCDEMAVRARHNIEVLVERLTAQGFTFHTNDDAQAPVEPFIPTAGTGVALLGWLEHRFESVPMTISSWLRLVGDVWFVGTHPRWKTSTAADPLVVEIEGLRWPEYSATDYFTGEIEAWAEERSDGQDGEGFVLPVAPDRLHKANVSGGAPYGIRLPDGCADAQFIGEAPMPFVGYLNWVFRNGGFPGVGDGQGSWRVTHSLAEGLLPL